MLNHLLYSPDLAPSDYYLFPNLKKFLVGEYFTLNEEAIEAMDRHFADKLESFYYDGIKLLQKCWTNC